MTHTQSIIKSGKYTINKGQVWLVRYDSSKTESMRSSDWNYTIWRYVSASILVWSLFISYGRLKLAHLLSYKLGLGISSAKRTRQALLRVEVWSFAKRTPQTLLRVELWWFVKRTSQTLIRTEFLCFASQATLSVSAHMNVISNNCHISRLNLVENGNFFMQIK